VKPAVQDRETLLEPDQVRLTGYLGKRIALSESARLLVVNEDELLGGFRNRPGSQDWIGEHVGKWLHAATLAWVNTGDPALKEKLDRVAKGLMQCQQADGYLGTYLPKDRWTSWDVWVHKYCLIGLLTYYKYTGDPDALNSAKRIGDLLCATFGKGRRDIITAGEHIGMAATSVMEPMVLLYRQTGDPQYLAFCRYILEAWDQPHGAKVLSSLLKYKAVNRVANGKAYEMLSNIVGLCELYRATGEPQLLQAAQYAWEDIVARRLYLTGSASQGECFHDDYFLPNDTAHSICETCVTVTWTQLNLQLLRLTGDPKYAEQLERTIYNHLLGAQKPTCDQWCYYTALEGKKPYGNGTCCCLSSGPRGIALIPQIAVTSDGSGAVINLFDSGETDLSIRGTPVQLRVTTRYPFDGSVRIAVSPERPVRFPLSLRIPAFTENVSLWVNGSQASTAAQPGRYAVIDRQWGAHDAVTLRMSLPTRTIVGDHTNQGRIAVMCGPLVLGAAESANPGVQPLRAVSLSASAAGGKAEGNGSADWRFEAPAKLIGRTKSGNPGDGMVLSMQPFSELGGDGSRYLVWFPVTGSASPTPTSLLAFGAETWSRAGNVDGDIADDDAHTYRVTFDGRKMDEDWYAVEVAQPVRVSRIVFAHGHCFHDGGWFDASAGKPRLEIKRTKDGPWEAVGTLDSYPATTATDANGLQDGQTFALTIPPTEVWGIRIIGKPACGDSPNQAFSSCAELQGLK
jgi:DUF1680 family protein